MSYTNLRPGTASLVQRAAVYQALERGLPDRIVECILRVVPKHVFCTLVTFPLTLCHSMPPTVSRPVVYLSARFMYLCQGSLLTSACPPIIMAHLFSCVCASNLAGRNSDRSTPLHASHHHGHRPHPNSSTHVSHLQCQGIPECRLIGAETQLRVFAWTAGSRLDCCISASALCEIASCVEMAAAAARTRVGC